MSILSTSNRPELIFKYNYCPFCHIEFEFIHNLKEKSSLALRYPTLINDKDCEPCLTHKSINLLQFFNQNTKKIYFYYVFTKIKKLPEQLHNVMLAHAANNDNWAKIYIIATTKKVI